MASPQKALACLPVRAEDNAPGRGGTLPLRDRGRSTYSFGVLFSRMHRSFGFARGPAVLTTTEARFANAQSEVVAVAALQQAVGDNSIKRAMRAQFQGPTAVIFVQQQLISEERKASVGASTPAAGVAPQAPPPVEQRAVAVCVMLSTGEGGFLCVCMCTTLFRPWGCGVQVIK